MTEQSGPEEGRFTGDDDDPDVVAIVVTYNSADDIEGLIASLRREALDQRIRLVVVDNASTDGTHELLCAHPDVETLTAPGNVGYAAGINIAMRHAGPDRPFLVLNPDLVVEPGAVAALCARLQTPDEVGVAVPKILNSAGEVYYSLRNEPSLIRTAVDGTLGRLWSTRPRWLSEYIRRPNEYDSPRLVDWATGAALLISPIVASTVGEWDEQFFLYSEETDYLYRVRKMGWSIAYCPDASMTHRGGGSGTSAELVALLAVNRVRYMEKHHPRSAMLYRVLAILAEQLRRRQASRSLARWALWRRSRWEQLPRAVSHEGAGECRPPVTVIIPAHNEAAVLAHTLKRLADLIAESTVQVIVVCNGCTDETASIARRFAGVTVLELATPSKTAALNAGDAVARHPIRIYLDADIVIHPGTVAALVHRLDEPGTLAARPQARYDTSRSGLLVRAYYRARQRMAASPGPLWGAGVYGLSATGHERLGAFPDLTADDLFVDRLFSAGEKAVVSGTPVQVSAPRRVADLLNVLTRARRGPAEQGIDTGRATLQALLTTLHGPGSIFDAAVYATLAILARRRVRRRSTTDIMWERDDSSRPSAIPDS